MRSLTWFQWSGDENNAAIPQTDKSIFKVNPGDEERLLRLYSESSAQLQSPQEAWKLPFTTFLQPNEDPSDFLWIGGWPGSAADQIQSAQVVNSLELAPFDDEMAALELPGEVIPEDPDPVPEEEPAAIPEEPEPVYEEVLAEEPAPQDPEADPVETEPIPQEALASLPVEPLPEEPFEPEHPASAEEPQETAPQPEPVAPETEPPLQQPHRERAPQPQAIRPQSTNRPIGPTAGRRKLRSQKRTPARVMQAAAPTPEKSKAMSYLIIGVAACVMLALGITIHYLTNRIDELEKANAQLTEEADDLRWRISLANKQNASPPAPQPQPIAPPTRPPTISPPGPPPIQPNPPTPKPTERPVNTRLIKLEITPPPGGLPLNQNINLSMVLESGLRQVLKKTEGPITPADFNKLGELNAEGLRITDLSGLQRAGNIRSLKLTNNKVSDLTPLREMTKLIELNLSGNRVSDISPLERLTNLQKLYLIRNPVSDIQPLGKMNQLTSLTLGPSEIKNHWPLAKLTNLKMAWLGNTQLEDLRPLQGLVELNKLVLNSNNIEDVEPLAQLTNLTELHLNNNRITNIKPLLRLTKVTDLELKNNPILTGQRELLKRELPNCVIQF